MSDIVKYEGQAQEASPEDLYEFMRQMYRTAYAITGYKIDKEKITQIDIPATISLVQELHPRRDHEDLSKAIKLGALGRYGEFTGINAKTIISWIDAYVKSDDFKEKLRESKTPKPELPPPPADYNQIWQEAKEQYKANGQTPKGAGSLYFNAAQKLGLFDWSDLEFVEDCKHRARIKMLDRAKQAADIQSLRHLKEELKNEEGQAFKAECRRQAVLIKLEDDTTLH